MGKGKDEMRILDVGLDLDGVMYRAFEWDLQHYCINQLGYDPETLPLPWTRWDSWREMWGMDEETFLRLCHEATDAGEMFVHGNVEPHAVEVINRLHDAGHQIHIITARAFGRRSPHNSADWLHKHGIPFESLAMVRNKKLMRPDIMLDDHEYNFADMWSVGVETWLYDQPWNDHVDTEYRVHGWLEFEEVVNRKAEA